MDKGSESVFIPDTNPGDPKRKDVTGSGSATMFLGMKSIPRNQLSGTALTPSCRQGS